MMKMATGGTIHPISELPRTEGEDSPDIMLHPGLEWPWEPGRYCAIRGRYIRRDGEDLGSVTHFAAMPGETIELQTCVGVP